MARKETSHIKTRGGIAVPVIHQGHPDTGPALPPKISTYVSVTWAWADESTGNITWTFVNSDPTNSHTVVLYRGATGVPNYIFEGAFWPIYLAAGYGFSMLDGTKPIPTLTGTGGQPMGILDYGPGASPRYLVHFIFTLGPGQTWSTPEGGFTGITPTPGVCYELTNSTSGTFCVGYDPARVAQWDSQTSSTTQGFSPNPSTFVTYAFQPEPTTPENTLGYNDSIGSGSCVAQNFYFVMGKNNYGHDEVKDNLIIRTRSTCSWKGIRPTRWGLPLRHSRPALSTRPIFPAFLYRPDDQPTTSATPARTPMSTQRIRFEYGVDFTRPLAHVVPGSGKPHQSRLHWTPLSAYTGKTSESAGGVLPVGRGRSLLHERQCERRQRALPQPGSSGVHDHADGEQPDVRSATCHSHSRAAIRRRSITRAAYTYIQNLITWLNKNFGYLNTTYTPPDTNVSDPLDSLLPEQCAPDGDSSVTPNTGPNKNYNFAIARVRMKGSSGLGRRLECQSLLPAVHDADL